MNVRKTKLAALVSLIFISGSLSAGELQSELKMLQDEHPLIRATKYAAEASDLRRQAAWAGFLPQISVSGDKGSENIKTAPEEGDELEPNTLTQRQKWSYTLEQNIFNGGKTFAELGIATADKDLKFSEMRASSQDVLLEAIIAYLQVLRNQLLIRLSEINEQTTLQQLEMEKARVERGGGVVVDELQAATRLQIVRERRVFYEQGMRDAIATYEQVFGRAPQLDKIQDLESFVSLIPSDIDEALTIGKEFNPRLEQIRLQIDRAERSISLEQASLMPKVDFVLSRVRDQEVAGIYQKNEDSALFKFSWTIFSGGDSINRTRAARLDRNEAIEREISTQRKTVESIRMTWNQYQKGLERLNLLEQAADTSRRVMEGRKRLRDAGRETVLAVLDAEVEHFGVLANKVNAMIDTRLGSYRLIHALGRLDMHALNIGTENFRLPVAPMDKVLEGLLGWRLPTEESPPPKAIALSEVQPVAKPLEGQHDAVQQTQMVEASAGEEPSKSPSAEAEPVIRALGQEIPAGQPPELDPSAEPVLTEQVYQWAQAWSSQDFDAYASFYSDNFAVERFKSKTDWLAYREPRIMNKASIRVELLDLTITYPESGLAEVRFIQDYEAGDLKVRSLKRLQMAKEPDGWKILWEGN